MALFRVNPCLSMARWMPAIARPQRLSSVNRRNLRDSQLKTARNYADRLARGMAFSKGALLLRRAAATASVLLLVLYAAGPCVVFFFAVSPKSAAQQLRLFELPVIFWRFGPLLSL